MEVGVFEFFKIFFSQFDSFRNFTIKLIASLKYPFEYLELFFPSINFDITIDIFIFYLFLFI